MVVEAKQSEIQIQRKKEQNQHQKNNTERLNLKPIVPSGRDDWSTA